MSINRRSFPAAALAITVMAGLGADAAQLKSDTKPNLLVVFTDQQSFRR